MQAVTTLRQISQLASITIAPSEFELFRELVLREHWRWPGPVFSVNPSGRIWPCVRNGYTPEAEREYIEGLSPVIDLVAEELLHFRCLGGRFFISEDWGVLSTAR